MKGAMKQLTGFGLTLFLLAGCGGGDSSPPANSSGSTVTPPPVVIETPIPDSPEPEPDSVPPPDTVQFSEAQLVPFDYAQRSSGQTYDPSAVQSASFANVTGSFVYPHSGDSFEGNLTVSFDIADPDGINNVFIGFEGNGTAFKSLCGGGCGTEHHQTISGINPLKFGANGNQTSQRLELWVEDENEHRVFTESLVINWQPKAVSGISATPGGNTLNLQWQSLTNYLRYNLYLSTDRNLSVTTYESVAISQQFLALTDTSFDIPNLEPDTAYYALIVGVNTAGESAFSETLRLTQEFGLNSPPVAKSYEFDINEDSPLEGSLIQGDEDADEEPVFIDITPTTDVKNGALSINEDGTFSYSPPNNFSGVEHFSYKIRDAADEVSEAVVTITINPVNDEPQALDNRYNMRSVDQQITVEAPGLLANDFDIDVNSTDIKNTQQLRVNTTPVDKPELGELTLREDGSFIFRPAPGAQIAADDYTFTYQVIDSQNLTTQATATITIDGDNNPPIATNDLYVIEENIALDTQADGHASILANDTAQDGDTINLSIVIPPANGLLTPSENGQFKYIPNTNFYGIDSFVYQISDSRAITAAAAVTIIILPQNDAPVALSDDYSLDEDTSLSVSAEDGVLNNDSDNDNDTLTVSLSSPASQGEVTLNNDGSFTYIPQADFFGTDTFIYTIDDGRGKDDSATVSLTVNNINDVPVANNDVALTNIDTPLTINVLENDSDVDNDELLITAANANNATTEIVENQILYSPTAGFSGTDTINYTIDDGQGGTASAEVTVTVNNNIHPPVAADDTYTLVEDNTLIVNDEQDSQPKLTANDTDEDGDNLTVVAVVTAPEHGTVNVGLGGEFTYQPESNFAGTDSFIYQVSDGNGGSDTATATITVSGVNDAPTAVDDAVLLNEDQSTVIEVLDNDFDVDGDVITIDNATVIHGQIDIIDGNKIGYHPPPRFLGTDIIEYNISDGHGGRAFANVTITISRPNRPPNAENDQATTAENQSVVIDVLANDSDEDDDPLTIISFETTNGQSVLNPNQTLTFTPTEQFNGEATIVYTISDGREGTDSATVRINVIGINENPIARNDQYTVEEDSFTDLNPITNDSDPDGDPLAIAEARAEHGNVRINPSNSLSYEPPRDFNGVDHLFYLLVDNNGGEAQGEITVTVTAVNDPPIAEPDSAAVLADATVTIDALQNDYDIDGDTLTITEAFAQSGSAVINDNQIVYTSNADFTGTDTIQYSIDDGHGGTASSQVVVSVGSDEHTPQAVNDQYRVDEDHTLVASDRPQDQPRLTNNDHDPDGDAIEVTGIIRTVEHGQLNVLPNGEFNYTPNSNFFGTDSFVYQISDPSGRTAQASAIITIDSVNDAPTAVDDAYAVDEGETQILRVLENDFDIEHDPLTIDNAQATHGRATVIDGTTISYVAPNNFSGVDFIEYNISDGKGGTDFANVAISINEVNDVPVAVDDVATTQEDQKVIIDVLSNDTDGDNDRLIIARAESPEGKIQITSENTLEFSPKPDFNGQTIIDYTISDNKGGEDSAKVTVTIIAVNDDPIAVDDAYTIEEDVVSEFTPLVNDSDIDGDTLAIHEAFASHGKVTVNGGQSLTYTPFENFNGTDILHYELVDGHEGHTTGTITVTITEVNDAPIARDDQLRIAEDASDTFDVLSNDSDPDGDTLTITAVETINGETTINSEQVLDFIPTADFNGLATITYTISDGHEGTDTATVVITVDPVNDNPVAVNDTYTIDEDTLTDLNPITNDSDIDGDPLSITAAFADHGTVRVNPSHSLTFEPEPDFNGIAQLKYTLADGHDGFAEGTVIVNITPVNDAPVAVEDNATVAEDDTVIIDVLGNDTDVDGDTLIITLAEAEHGSVSINSDTNLQTTNAIQASLLVQTLTYIPDADYNGPARINYTISDGTEQSSTTVNVNVTPVNDAPTISDTSGDVSESAANGTVIVTLSANDIDNDGPLSFDITSGNIDSVFGIDPASGEITVLDNTFLNFEITPVYLLTITVTDSGGLNASNTVTINVTDAGENETLIADTTFGNEFVDGTVLSNAYVFDTNDVPSDAVIDSLGRITVTGTIDGGDISVTRYLADGRIDLGFARQGRTRSDLGLTETSKAVSIGPDGNIYIAGEIFTGSSVEIFVVKLMPDGTPDNNFGTDGVFITTLGQSNVHVGDVLALSDHFIMVGAGVNNQFTVLQLDNTGALTSTLSIDMPGDFDQVEAMAEQSDGKVIVAGHTADSANNFTYDFAVARITTGGTPTLDTTFNGTGMNVFDLGETKSDMIYAVELNSQNHIVLVGSFLVSSGICDIGVAVLNPDGILDEAFGTAGIAIIDADGDGGANTGNSFATSLDIDSSGNLFIGTQFGMTAADYDFGVVKTSANGTVDSAFGAGGAVSVDIGSSQNTMAAVMLDAQQQPIVITSAQGIRNQDFAIARFTAAGLLDTSFLNEGFNLTNQTPSDDILHGAIGLDVAPHTDKIVMVGQTNSNSSVTDAILARYTANGQLDSTFGNEGYFHITTNSSSSYVAKSVEELDDGRLIVVGQFNLSQPFLMMLDANGKLDSTFAEGGLLFVTPTGSQAIFNSVDIDNNGKIVAVGSNFNATIDLYLARFNTDGTADTTFNATGSVTLDLQGNLNEALNRVSILEDNSLVVVGTHDNKALIAKFLNNGTLDTTGFNAGSGFQAIDVDNSVTNNVDELFDVTVEEGIIYTSGASNSASTDLITVLALNADGSLKTDFGSDGSVIYSFGSGHAAQSLSIDLNGRLVLTGHTHNATDGGDDVFIARLTSDGAQDPLFNSGNAFLIDHNATDSSEVIGAMDDGTILIGGHNTISEQSTKVWYLTRYKLVNTGAIAQQ